MLIPLLLLLLLSTITATVTAISSSLCKPTYCGNITLTYPFSTIPTCGFPAFTPLLFCINNMLMLHISSGTYLVLSIDYAFNTLTLHDASMSTCSSLSPSTSLFSPTPSLSSILQPSKSTLFLLLHCNPTSSPLFKLCRNTGCKEYYTCPAWNGLRGREEVGVDECCSIGYEEIKDMMTSGNGKVNESDLGCDGYSSVYRVAPVRVGRAAKWRYGIMVDYMIPESSRQWCRECEASGGSCGFQNESLVEVCYCDGVNSNTTASITNCDQG
ncbi:unknownprotein [Zostera marina]|uniref:Wall-associated receptor kinase galacturonan-binding domain-containing protein n=1 Tax=Zostera marina TaxID=29655 RepID=A0A0K9Q4R4_ZOSMR|nr:unknownprotein [Zostera marina]